MDGLVVTLRDPTGRWLAGRPRSRGCGPCPLRECRWWGRRGGQFALAEGLGAGLVDRDEPAVGGALVAQPEHGEGLGFLDRGPEQAPAAGPGALDDGDVAEHAAVADEHLGVGPVLAGVGEDALGDGILGRLVRARSCTFGHGVSLPGVADASRVRRVPPDRGGPDAADRTAVPADRCGDPAAVLHRALVRDDVVAGHRGAVGKRSAHGHRNVAGGGPGRAGALVTRAPVLLPAVWDPDRVGLALARAVVARLAPDGAAVPFLARQVCLPVLFRLHIPKTSASKTEQARAMVDLLARPCPGAPSTWWRRPASADRPGAACPPASLHHPPGRQRGPAPTRTRRTGRRGHPAWKGERLGSAAEIAAAATWRRTRVTRYGTTETVDLAVITCLWWGSLHRTPIRVVLVRGTSQARPYTLAPATTDLASTGGQIVARYASRWSSNSRSRTARTSWAPAEIYQQVLGNLDQIIAALEADQALPIAQEVADAR